jgi:hypothetical protein
VREVSEELELISSIQKGLTADDGQPPPAGSFCFVGTRSYVVQGNEGNFFSENALTTLAQRGKGRGWRTKKRAIFEIWGTKNLHPIAKRQSIDREKLDPEKPS